MDEKSVSSSAEALFPSWPESALIWPGKPAMEVSAGVVALMERKSASQGCVMSRAAPPTTTTASPAASRNARMRGSLSWRTTGEVGSGVAGGMALSMRATRSSPVEEASDAPSEISGSLILR